MIEGLEQNALVILNVVSPKEKFYGVLRSLSAAIARSPASTINAVRAVLTLISDDNFLPFQRTLLLQFTLAEP